MDSPASMDLIAGLFQKQASRLEAQLLQQLSDKRVIEHLHNQLVATANLVESLESQHTTQAQQIEKNLQKAISIYERARVMRKQQIDLRHVVATLRSDVRILRGRAPRKPEEGDDAASGRVVERELELPHITELLPGLGSTLGEAAAPEDGAAAANRDDGGAARRAAHMGCAANVAGPMVFAGAASAPMSMGVTESVAIGSPVARSGTRVHPSPPGTDTALEALALLSTVATASGGLHGPALAQGSLGALSEPPLVLGEGGATAAAASTASTLPAPSQCSRHLSGTTAVANALGSAPDLTSMGASRHTGIPTGYASASQPLAQQGIGRASHRPRVPSPLAVASTHRPQRASSMTKLTAPAAISSSAHGHGNAASPGRSQQMAAEVTGQALLAHHPSSSRHTTLTEHSLTAHDGGMAAAGMAGPGAMGMWMNGARGRVPTVEGLPAQTEHSRVDLSTRPSKRAARDEGAHGSKSAKTTHGSSAHAHASLHTGISECNNGHSSDSGNERSDATSVTAPVSDAHTASADSKTPSPSSPTETGVDALAEPSTTMMAS